MMLMLLVQGTHSENYLLIYNHKLTLISYLAKSGNIGISNAVF